VTDDCELGGHRVAPRIRSITLVLIAPNLRRDGVVHRPFPGGSLMSRDQRRAARRIEPTSFRCRNCRLDVPTHAHGTAHRNHCPNCLWSRHLDDDSPGDRAADCGSLMEPIAISVRGDGEWVVVHRCTGCDELHLNRSAGDDNPLMLLRLAVRPLAQPPFPIERIGEL
jgi:RNHCP domain